MRLPSFLRAGPPADAAPGELQLWVAEEPPARQLERFLSAAPQPSITRRAIAQVIRGRTLSPAVLDLLATEPRVLESLAENTLLDEETRRAVEQRAIDVLRRHRRAAKADVARPATKALAALYRNGLEPDPVVRDDLLSMLRGRGVSFGSYSSLKHHAYAGPALALEALLAQPYIEPNTQAEMLDALRLDVALVARLIEHPSAVPALWVNAASHCRDAAVHDVLAANPQARADEEVMRQLKTTSSPKAVALIVRHCCEEDAKETLANFARWKPVDVLNLIEENPSAARLLDPQVLAPLLQSANRPLRLRALQAMSLIRRQEDGAEPDREGETARPAAQTGTPPRSSTRSA